MERVLLARHGETEWNLLRRRQGRLDSPLTSVGRAQTGALAELLAGRGVDALFTSPLGRALATAELLAARVGCDVAVLEELAEVDHGEMAGFSTSDIEARFPGALAARAADRYHWRFPGGESYADAHRRAAQAIEQIELSGAMVPLIVSHEMIGRMLLLELAELDRRDALARSQGHGTVYEVELACRAVRVLEVGASFAQALSAERSRRASGGSSR